MMPYRLNNGGGPNYDDDEEMPIYWDMDHRQQQPPTPEPLQEIQNVSFSHTSFHVLLSCSLFQQPQQQQQQQQVVHYFYHYHYIMGNLENMPPQAHAASIVASNAPPQQEVVVEETLRHQHHQQPRHADTTRGQVARNDELRQRAVARLEDQNLDIQDYEIDLFLARIGHNLDILDENLEQFVEKLEGRIVRNSLPKIGGQASMRAVGGFIENNV